MATVIQADRIAAAYGSSSIQYVKDDILAGKLDDHPRVVSYAAHREASTTQLEADRASLIQVLKEAVYWDGCDADGVDAVWLEEAEQAIARIEGDRS
jgi:hypothetical protein